MSAFQQAGLTQKGEAFQKRLERGLAHALKVAGDLFGGRLALLLQDGADGR